MVRTHGSGWSRPAAGLVALTMSAGCSCRPCEQVRPFDQDMPRTILATLEVDGSQWVETSGLLAIYDLSSDTVAHMATESGKPGPTHREERAVTYRYSALLRDARMTMLPQGNVMLDSGVLYVHAKKIVGPVVDAADRAGSSVACAAPGRFAGSVLPVAVQLATWAIAAPSITTAPTTAMITWFPIVVKSPIRAATIGTDFIVQAIEGDTPASSIVRVFLVSEDSTIAIEPEPWNGPGDPPVVHLDSPRRYFQVVGQDFTDGMLLDMTAEQWAFVAGVRKDAERLGVE